MQQPNNKKEQKQTLVQKAKDEAEYQVQSATNPDASTYFGLHVAAQPDNDFTSTLCAPCTFCCNDEACDVCNPCQSCCATLDSISTDASAGPRDRLPPIFFSPGGVGHVQMERM